MYNVEMINKDVVEKRFDFTDEKIDTLKEAIVFSFENLNGKIDVVNSRLGRHDERFDQIDLRFDSMDKRLYSLESKVDQNAKDTEERFSVLQEAVEFGYETLNSKMEDGFSRTDAKLAMIMNLLTKQQV